MAEKFVLMEKDGERIEVSPLCVEDHKRLRWKVVEASAEEPEAPSLEAKPRAPRVRKSKPVAEEEVKHA